VLTLLCSAPCQIWDLREGRLLFTVSGHDGGVPVSNFSPDGEFFASGGRDQLVMVWKANLLNSTGLPQQDEQAPATKGAYACFRAGHFPVQRDE
jgi:WD40 repeat protein